MKKEKKGLRILAAGDLHGSERIAKTLAEKAKKEKVDLVVLAGDLHGSLLGSGEVILPFKKAKQKVVFVPGNWDSSLEVDILRYEHGIKNLDAYYVSYNGVDIVGFGNPDFDLFPSKSAVFRKLNKNFERIKTKSGKKILVSHLHAAGTKAEKFGFEGNQGLREVVEKFQPDVLISAHIHEAEGIEDLIGKTKVFQVGRKGKIIDV
jgi:putative phosphoesterase